MSLNVKRCMKSNFLIKDFSNKCDQIRSFLLIWSHLLKKFLIEFFFYRTASNLYLKIQLGNITSVLAKQCFSVFTKYFFFPMIYQVQIFSLDGQCLIILTTYLFFLKANFILSFPQTMN